jgi:adenylate kinase
MNIIILGPQGSGKGTQAELLQKKLGLRRFEAGKELRSVTDPEIKKIIDAGELAPQGFVKQLVEVFLSQNKNSAGFLFDGYPRTAEQYEELKNILAGKIDYVFNIEISESETIRRLSARRTCSKCGEIYNLITKKPAGELCDICGGELVHREDDKPESIQKRLAIYRTQTHPVFEKAAAEGIGIEINGEQSIDVIHQEILARINDQA